MLSEHYIIFCFVYISDVEKERLESNVVPTNIYDSMCVPDLGGYLAGTPTPAHTPTSSASTTNNNFIPEGKSTQQPVPKEQLCDNTDAPPVFLEYALDIPRKSCLSGAYR